MEEKFYKFIRRELVEKEDEHDAVRYIERLTFKQLKQLNRLC